jgi:hypothetical protein
MLIVFAQGSGFARVSLSKYFLAACIFLFLPTACQMGFAQCSSCDNAMNAVSAHAISGRGCVGCHPAHTQPCSEEGDSSSRNGTWGGAITPYCKSIAQIDKNGGLVPQSETKATVVPEVAHVLLCLSCHDGNLAPQNMIANQSYAEFGPVGNAGHKAIASLRGKNDWTHSMEHPLGPRAVIPLGNGLQFVNGEFSIVAGSRYAEFVANYGWPTLAPVRGGARGYGITVDGKPYVLCTTCHNPHSIQEYASRPESPIAGDGGGHYYTTFFSLNGPYNPYTHNLDGRMATSNVQFCRQCHFDLANEGNNVFGIHTIF